MPITLRDKVHLWVKEDMGSNSSSSNMGDSRVDMPREVGQDMVKEGTVEVITRGMRGFQCIYHFMALFVGGWYSDVDNARYIHAHSQLAAGAAGLMTM